MLLKPLRSTGIGLHIAEQLAIHGAKVYLACRSEAKALEAIGDIEKRNPTLKASGRLVWQSLDLSSICASKRAAEEIASKEQHLHILSENLGAWA